MNRYPTASKRIVAALQRCPSGLGTLALTRLAYGDTSRTSIHALHQAVYRLRAYVRIDRIETGHTYGCYRLIEEAA